MVQMAVSLEVSACDMNIDSLIGPVTEVAAGEKSIDSVRAVSSALQDP